MYVLYCPVDRLGKLHALVRPEARYSQALLWMLDDSPRLGPPARQAITSAQGVHVSAATVWELTIKSMLGKLTVPHDLSQKASGAGRGTA